MNLCPRSSESPMKRWMQWTACTAELLGTFVAAMAAAGWYLAGQKRQRMLEPKTVRVEYTLNTATLERGRYLFAARGCVCHGAKGQGPRARGQGPGARGASLSMMVGARGWQVPTSRPPGWWHATSPKTGTA